MIFPFWRPNVDFSGNVNLRYSRTRVSPCALFRFLDPAYFDNQRSRAKNPCGPASFSVTLRRKHFPNP